MPPQDPAASARKLYEKEVARHVIALREALIRHDENLKAWKLMSEVCPYFLKHHDEIALLRERSYTQVEHLIESDAYERYYGDNPHEASFEEQAAGIITIETADRVPRVAWLKERLKHRFKIQPPTLLDLGCNDGWMLAHLHWAQSISDGAGIDLAPACLERATARLPGFQFVQGFVEQAPVLLGTDEPFDAVVCFEVMEHVLDPMRVIEAAYACLKPKGKFYFSCPDGADMMGDIPDWDKLESKGHVRVVTKADIREWILRSSSMFDPTTMSTVKSIDGLLLTEVQRNRS